MRFTTCPKVSRKPEKLVNSNISGGACGSSSRSVSGVTEPSRWRCISAFGSSCMNSGIPAIMIGVPMTAEEVEAIIDGYHGDAFRILGPHAVRKRGNQPRWEVRAFLPQAESAEVVLAGRACPMAKRHAAGFFVGALDGE